MILQDLFHGISYRLAGNLDSDCLSRKVSSVTARPSEADADALFVCVRTALFDGHDAAAAVYGAGCRLFLARHSLPLPADALVLLTEEPEALLGELAARCLGHPARRLTVFGVTGTAGKTTVVQMTATLLARTGHKVATLTTDGEQIGRACSPAGNVVPDAVDIQRFLRRAADAGATFAILELSSYMLAQKSAFSIPFAAVLLTNLWPEHIGNGEHASAEDYFAAKASLVTSANAPFCVLPTDHAELARPPRGRCLFHGEGGDLAAQSMEPYADETGLGTHFTLCTPTGEKVPVSLPVAGDFMVENAVCAASLAMIAGLTPVEIAAGLSACAPCGRMACVAARAGRYILTDAAYTAKSLSRALQALRPLTRGRLAVVIGSVGGRARARRAPLGAAASTYADMAYFTADDPDGEDPLQICREMAAGAAEVNAAARYVILPDRAKAICRAVLEMRPGDVLLLAGKGGQKTQLIRGERIPFSEEDIAREALLSI